MISKREQERERERESVKKRKIYLNKGFARKLNVLLKNLARQKEIHPFERR